MCGVWCSIGVVPPRDVIRSVAHRGPDGEGWQQFDSPAGPVVLGHRRLAILDVSDAGLQPMCTADRATWVAYNGELYNFVELRAELEALGARFRTGTDTEVLLAAYEAWGIECLHRFNGMFAFVLWDARRKRLFAVRDRFGIKPLYVCRTRAGLHFASEIKQFTFLEGFQSRLNPSVALDFVATGVGDQGVSTLFEGVEQLRGGELMEVDASRPVAGAGAPRRWYTLHGAGADGLSEADTRDKMAFLLEDAVRLRLRSDVPVGSCLSGGLDSSAIVCLADRALRAAGDVAQFRTISACFDVSRIDERRYIDVVSEHTGIENVKVFPSARSFLDDADAAAWSLDTPAASASAYAQWCVFREARKEGFKVMLDGQGADEQLAGYSFMYGVFHARLLSQLRWWRLFRELQHERRLRGISVRAQGSRLLAAALPAWTTALGTLAGHPPYPDWVRRPAARNEYHSTSGTYGGILGSRSLRDLSRHRLCEVGLPRLLRNEDRNSMAHGVEARVPFLDVRLVEFLFDVADEHKIRFGQSKFLLREAMKGTLPETIRGRHDKLGFAAPGIEWTRGELASHLKEQALDAIGRFPGLFDPVRARAALTSGAAGEVGTSLLWRMASLGTWGRVFAVSM